MAREPDTLTPVAPTLEQRIAELISRMTLAEKIGQLNVMNTPGPEQADVFNSQIAAGEIGGILNEVGAEQIREFQRIAREDSRLGIPLLVGRDVIHGFKTVFPIPLGLAASWNPDIVRDTARIAAREAVAAGVNWTYAPMLDIGRDPRWGRVAETFGEDPWLAALYGQAMIEGFQGDDLSDPASVAACAKHFAGYGASESGRDYNTTNIPENELRNVHLPPFKAAADAGVATFMTSFSDLDGIPASANDFLLRKILREEWGYNGMVVSDWESIPQLAVHGLTDGDKASALAAASAGVDMEMASRTYADHLADLVDEGRLTIAQIDAMVANVLRVKFALGLFDERTTIPVDVPKPGSPDALGLAKQAALESCVLLKNQDWLLPLSPDAVKSVAVIGPLADDGYEQLGTWVFDGDPALSQTPLQALREVAGDRITINHVRALETTRSRSRDGFDEAIAAARQSDVVLLFLGEESILSGEAHSRADIGLPGNQAELIHELAKVGTPVVLVVMAGRPLALQDVAGSVDAILYAWHPGTMAGPAIVDLLFGREEPVGKLTVTFPRVTGQIPIYYSQKNTGRPATPESVRHIDEIEQGASQHSFGNTSFHLDVDPSPMWPFGYGLSYTRFRYDAIRVESDQIMLGETVAVSAEVTNIGTREGTEVVQLYVRDRAGSVTRPVRELKGFQRVRLQPGETKRVRFELSREDLAFYGRDMRLKAEPGWFDVWIGGDSTANLGAEFELMA